MAVQYSLPRLWRIALLIIFCAAAQPLHAQDKPTDLTADTPAAGNGIVDDVIKQFQNKDDNSTTGVQGMPTAPTATAPDQATDNPTPIATAPAPLQGIAGIVAQGDNATLPQVPTPPPTYEDHKTVILHALDKVTARTQTLEVPVGQQFNFGALTIAVRACRARPPLEPADAAAFLQIVEQKPGEPMIARFSGWMFASAPSLSALEHPVYDVWVVSCGGDKIVTDAKTTAPGDNKTNDKTLAPVAPNKPDAAKGAAL